MRRLIEPLLGSDDQAIGARLYYLVDWLPPDFGAVGQYGVLFARQMAEEGRDVCLIGLTSSAPRIEHEEFPSGGRFEIRRVQCVPADKSSNFGRLLWAFRANLRLIAEVRCIRNGRSGELLFTGSPPFMLFFAVPTKWLTGARLRYRITDFYPEVIVAHRGKASFALSLLGRMTWWLRRRVNLFEVLGEDQRRILTAGNIASERIVIKRDLPPVAITGHETPCAKPAELAGHLVLLYSGNYGVAHDVDTVFEGYRRHHREGSGRFALWLNATGANADVIERRLKGEGLVHARTAPGPLSELPRLMAAADAHLITLRDEFAGYVLPSKVYACLASRRPVLFVGPTESDVHLLCSQSRHSAYAHVRSGDAVAFVAALERLADAMSAGPLASVPAE